VKRRLQRFAAVGSVVTLADLGTFLLLAAAVGWPPLIAGALALAVATVASWGLHRAITFADDPFARWTEQPLRFFGAAALGAALDLATITAVVGLEGATTGGAATTQLLLVAKVAAIGVGALARLAGYRHLLFRSVRDDQGARTARTVPPGELRLSVVVPAYHEGEHIAGTVTRLRAVLGSAVGQDDVEVVVVDDGSGDGTPTAAEATGARVLRHPANRGKGAAVRTGVLGSRGRAIVITDADLSYPPELILDVLAGLEAGWDVVAGSRGHPDSVDEDRSALRALSSRLFNAITVAVLLGRYRDTQCGLKGFRSDVARVLFTRTRLDGFAFDVELLHLIERYRLSLLEIPVRVEASGSSTVRVGRHALAMVLDLFRVRKWSAEGAYELDPDEAGLIAGAGEDPGRPGPAAPGAALE
jgi:dolichyl-phosphate beta-glucosyltransferase